MINAFEKEFEIYLYKRVRILLIMPSKRKRIDTCAKDSDLIRELEREGYLDDEPLEPSFINDDDDLLDIEEEGDGTDYTWEEVYFIYGVQ